MNKAAFITGANKGIGFGISKYLGQSGWDIESEAAKKQSGSGAGASDDLP